MQINGILNRDLWLRKYLNFDGVIKEKVWKILDYSSEEDFENPEVIGWLYQYFISEEKARVFSNLRDNIKIEKNDIPYATQLFTPDWIAKFLGTDTIVSIMSQFEPKYVPDNYPELKNKITPLEYKRVVSYALKLNLKNAYTQELSSADTKYTPKF